MLYAIDEAGYEYHRRTAFVDSFLIDFRALYYFLWGGKSTEVRCYDFVDIKKWQPPKLTQQSVCTSWWCSLAATVRT